MALVLVMVPVLVVLVLRGTGPDPVDDAAGPSPAPTAVPSEPPSSPAPTPSDAPTDDGSEDEDGVEAGGGLDGMLEDLMGGMNPATLAACMGSPSGDAESPPDDVQAAIDQLADQVAAERQLALTDPIDPVLLTPDEMRDRIVELTRRDYPAEAADVDARLLASLGAIPRDTDLRELQLDLLGGQVAGFYDPETGELTAIAAEGGLDPVTRMTLVHEIDHALTDQAIGLPDLDGFDGRADAGLAALAVVEGDASLLMQRWAMQQLSLMDQLGAATDSLGPADQLQSAPWILQQQLVFPYTAGLEFACERFLDGGWAAIDALYADPPTTSAQVMWPDRFAAGEGAVDVDDPTLPDGWDEVRRDQLGAADLLWLFQAPGDDRAEALPDAEERARAWAGGEVAVGTRGDASVVTATLAEHADATVPLCDSITDWYAAAFPDATAAPAGDATTFTGSDQAAAVDCDADRVRLGIAPDADTARAAAGG